MNDQFQYRLTNNMRVMTLWQEVEAQIMYAQDDWFSGQKLDAFNNENFALIDDKTRNKFKKDIADAVHTGLKTQLWDKFDEDEYKAFLDLANDYVFIGNGVFHSYFILFMSNEHLTFDAFCIFMREWVAANADKLCNMSTQERNNTINKKVLDTNNYLIGNRFSEKLISAMQLSLTSGFNSKAAMEMKNNQTASGIDESQIVWRITKKPKWIDCTDYMVNTLPYIQHIVTMPLEDDEDFMTIFNRFCAENLTTINEGNFRSLVTFYLWKNLKYILSCETLGDFSDMAYAPNGMLGILIEHVSHSYQLITNKTQNSISFSVGRINLANLSNNEEAMIDYIKGYATAIKGMYNELPSYRDEVLTEIVKSHLTGIAHCYTNGLENYDFDALIEVALN